jgi:putative transposase
VPVAATSERSNSPTSSNSTASKKTSTLAGSDFTPRQLPWHEALALSAMEGGAKGLEMCREFGISEATLYNWKKRYAGMGVSELRRLKQLEDENRRLRGLVVNLTLDKHILQEVLRKKP